MAKHTNEQLATLIALPTVTTLLIWTVAIFHKNRKKWGPYDIPIVSLLTLSIIRNVTIVAYLVVSALLSRDSFSLESCSVIVWIFNSLHTFQASSLTTIAVIGLFSVKLHRKQQNLRQFLTPTHIVYHLFCLTTLCACVGVAAILAQNETLFQSFATSFEASPCKFMPFNLDVKFNVFILVLHVFLAAISLVSFLIVCYNCYRSKRANFDYLKKSNSDLSDISNTFNPSVDNAAAAKSYYDTYTVHRGGGGHNFDPTRAYQFFQNGFCAARDINWNSDLSNMSTTVSSTNSRRPCLGKAAVPEREEEELNRTGLETIHPVLIVCYLFYHLPVIVLCIYPQLIFPWPVVGIALWLGLVQDLLIPVGLGIVDTRFSKWVIDVYRCSGQSVEDKLPHVGLDGKFRPFGTASQPQSLDISNPDRTIRSFQTVEHRFPITNGSLYTSIDGRLPVIHNYRRHKDLRGGHKQLEKQSSNVALHSSHLNRDYVDIAQKFPSCSNCEADLCPSHSNLHHLSPHYINKQLNLLQQQNLTPRTVLLNRATQSQESLRYLREPPNRQVFSRNSELNVNNHVMKNSRNLVRLNRMRLTRSEDSLNDLQIEAMGNIQRPASTMCQPPVQPHPQTTHHPQQQTRQNVTKVQVNVRHSNGYSSSDDDYLTDNHTHPNDYDSASSKSCYSITTEANCDFEFYQNNDRKSVLGSSFSNKNFRITRSNSKRSLENFQAFVEVESVDSENNNNNNKFLNRSNSYVSLGDTMSNKRGSKKLLRSDSKLSDNNRQRIRSVEYLPSSNASTIFIEDLNRFNYYYDDRNGNRSGKYVGSVPDLKKVFISEYI